MNPGKHIENKDFLVLGRNNSIGRAGKKTSLIREDAQVLLQVVPKPRVCYCRSGAILAL